MSSDVARPEQSLATRDDIRRLEAMIGALTKTMDRIAHDQDVQFKRIAQLQADIDLIRAAWSQILPSGEATASATPKRTSYGGPERRVTARKK